MERCPAAEGRPSSVALATSRCAVPQRSRRRPPRFTQPHRSPSYSLREARFNRQSLAVQDEGSRAGEPSDDEIFGEGPGWRAADSADGFLAAGPLGALGGGLLGWLLTRAAKKRLRKR